MGYTAAYTVASRLLAPLLALQGHRLHRRAPTLAEPPGSRSGRQGLGPPLRLLIAGDSAAAGVGAPTQEEALSGHLVRALAPTYEVNWTLIARTGATAAGTARHFARRSAEECATTDVAVLCLGVNDLMARQPLQRWLEDVGTVVETLRRRFAVRHVFLSGFPPLQFFPAFPQPLRWYLGGAAKRFDRALSQWATSQRDCEHVPLPYTDGDGLFASDGLHPGPLAYRLWSEVLAERIRARWAAPASPEWPRPS